MTNGSKTTAAMYAAASQSQTATYGYIFMETDKGVTCYAPPGRVEEAKAFIEEMKSITVAAVYQDWNISDMERKTPRPPVTNKTVTILQAALDAAKLSSRVFVFPSDNHISINTNGPKLEVYQALFLFRTATIEVYENGFFTHGC